MRLPKHNQKHILLENDFLDNSEQIRVFLPENSLNLNDRATNPIADKLIRSPQALEESYTR